MMPVVDTGLRRTALTLHALSAADRQWVTERLPQHQREQVMALVEELTALGIPRDSSLVFSAVPPPAAAPAPAVSGRALSGADDPSVAALLRSEPAALIAMVRTGNAPRALRDALRDEIAARTRAVKPVSTKVTALRRRWQAGWLRITGGLG